MLTALMPATPAWPPQSTPRLFVEAPLSEGTDVRIEGGQAHYLSNVMRLKEGAPVKLFDDQTGEWLAEVAATGKRDIVLRVVAQLRPREDVPDLGLLAAPVKKARLDMVVEKACELGVALYRPVITRRTIVERLNMDRLRTTMVEAAEQSGRTAVPELPEPVTIDRLLRDWPAGRALIFADETGGEAMASALARCPAPAAILIGPEGGFTPPERDAIRAHSAAVPISLGPRILRADTAALAAIAVWQAINGQG
jgi:16S rRNA (uracil1498-N3)-methyltransferase